MPTGYTVLQAVKGALVYECDRCGAVVFHVTTHDAWHVVIEHRHDVVCEVLSECTDGLP